MPTLHDPVDLEVWAHTHLAYELRQLVGSTLLQVRHELVHASLSSAAFVSNALNESNLSHLRVLDDFFRSDHASTGEDRVLDVLAVDYTPDLPPEATLTAAEREEVDARLAHVSIERADGGAPWPIADTTGRAVQRFAEFVTYAEAPGHELAIASPQVLRDALSGALAILTAHGFAVPTTAA